MKKGFTLVSLVVILVITGLLFALLIYCTSALKLPF
ncbi:MAG: hypothetical protein ACRC2T_10690 [Thermoguttaceae bacterium]